MIRVKERYHTGLPKLYELDGLEFLWTDWVLCEIAWEKGNVPHWCIASSFRGDPERPRERVTCAILNPTYESMRANVDISRLSRFRPVKVISEARERPE